MANKKDNKVQKKLLKKLIKKEKKKPNEADTINKYKKQLEKTKLGVALKLLAKEKLTKQTSDKLDADAKLKNDAEQNQIQNQLVQRELIQKYRDFQPKLSRDDLIKYIQDRERFLLPLNIEIPKVSQTDAVKTFETRDKKEKRERLNTHLKELASIKKTNKRKEIEQKKVTRVVDETKRLKGELSTKKKAIQAREGDSKLTQEKIDHYAKHQAATLALNDAMTSLNAAGVLQAGYVAEKQAADNLEGQITAKKEQVRVFKEAHPAAGRSAQDKLDIVQLMTQKEQLVTNFKALRGKRELNKLIKTASDQKNLIKARTDAEGVVEKLEASPLYDANVTVPYDRTALEQELIAKEALERELSNVSNLNVNDLDAELLRDHQAVDNELEQMIKPDSDVPDLEKLNISNPFNFPIRKIKTGMAKKFKVKGKGKGTRTIVANLVQSDDEEEDEEAELQNIGSNASSRPGTPAAAIPGVDPALVGMGFKFKPKYERYYKRYTIPSNKFKANGDLTSKGVKHLKILQKLKTSKVLGHLLGISILNKHAKSAKPSVIKAGKFMINAMKHITRHLKGK